MQKYAFDPNTGKVFTPNKDVEGGWEELGHVNDVDPSIKYKQGKTAQDADGNTFKFNKFTKAWEEVPTGSDLVDYIPAPNAVKRGLRDTTLVDDYIGLQTGLSTEEDYAKAAKDVELRNKQIPMSSKQRKGVEAITNPNQTFTEFSANVIKNPEATGVILGESIGSMAGAGAAALGLTGVGRLAKLSPWALTAISAGTFGTGSGVVEATTSFMEGLKEEGVNTLDETAVKAALEDTALRNKLETKALVRGMTIGTFDAITGGLAGKIGGPILSKGITKGNLLKAGVAETGLQAAGGAGGEAAAQIATEGKITNMPAVGLEAIMEGVMGVPQAVVQSMITSPTSEHAYPVFKDLKGTAEEFKIDEEVVGPAKEKIQQQKVAKAPITEEVVDTTEVKDLSGFSNLVEQMQPEELRVIEDYNNNVNPKPETSTTETSTVPEVTTAPINKQTDLKLPKDLQGAKPRYKTAKIDFPSDIEKALYIVANRDTKSRKDDNYYKWLQNTVGLSDSEINSYGRTVKNDLKAKHNVLEDGINTVKADPLNLVDNDTTGLKAMGKGVGAAIGQNFIDGWYDTLSDGPRKSSAFKGEPQWKSTEQAFKDGKIKSSKQLRSFLENKVKYQANPAVATSPVFNNAEYQTVMGDLKGIKYKPTLESNINYTKEIERGVRSVLGNVPVNIQFFEDLKSFNPEYENVGIRGFQHLNTIGISMNIRDGVQTDPFDTGMHEAYHWLRRYGALTESDERVISAQRNRIEAYVRVQTGLLPEDIETLYSSEEGVEEIEAIAFGIWSSNRLRDSKYKTSKFTPMLSAIFDKLLNTLGAIGKAFKGKSFEDVFQDIYEGRRATDVVKDATDYSTYVRWQKITQKAQAKEQSKKTQYAYKAVNELEQAVKYDNSQLGPIGTWGRYVNSMQHLASKSKVMAYVFDTYRTKENIANYVMAKADAILKESNFYSLSRPQVDTLHNLMDYARQSKQKAYLDEEGYLNFVRNNKIVRLKDKEMSKQYITLQKSYSFVKEQVIDNAKYKIAKNLGLSNDFTRDEVIKKLEATKDKSKQQIYTNILDTLTAFEEMKATDYVPYQRFGDFGLSVKDKKSGKLVYFKGIERGEFLNKHKQYFNKMHLQEALEDLKSKYSDTTKYEIYGAKGRIKDLSSIDNLDPYVLTHNNITSNLGDAMVSFDMLFSMLQSKDVDMGVLEDVQTKFYDQIINKGFAKHMLQSENIDGYSKDWTRVQHSYLTGASNYIGNLVVNDRINSISKVVKEGNFKDKNLKDAMTAYVNYLNSPQEDYMRMRMFNFTWTMGMNFSTAALQTMTLPTTTLANITKFNMNPVSNMAAINKWFWVGGSYFNEMAMRDGTLIVDFDTEEKIKDLIKKGLLTEGGAKLLRFMSDSGLTTAVQMEEYAGRKAYDTRSLTGKTRDQLSIFSNLVGAPISIAEQMTRFATVMSAYEQLNKVPNVQEKIAKVFANDQLFQQKVETHKGHLDLVQLAAWHIMDDAHAVFGKLARAPWERGLGGALFFPFMRYPHNALESMVRMWGQGAEGKAAIVTTLGTMFVFAGLIGLPGAELLKELYEEAHKRFKGEEIDLDFEIRKAIYDTTKSERLAKLITQGSLRAAGVDMAKRIGMQVPGQDAFFGLTGIRGDAGDVLGVQGSLLTQIGEAWAKYNTDATLRSTIASLSPTAVANIIKAVEYADEGVYTSKNQKLVDNEDLGMTSVVLRGFGFTSDEVASYRERNFYSKLLGTKINPFLETQRERAKKAITRYYEEMDKGNDEKASQYQDQYVKILDEVLKKSQDTGIPVNMAAFGRSVMKGAMQRRNPEETFTLNLPKAARSQKEVLDSVLGINNSD